MRVCVAAVCAVLFAAPAAIAGNSPHPTLDAVATAVAGKPVTVHCENSWYDWIVFFADQGIDGGGINGFTSMSRPVVFVSPRQCETLHALINREVVGTYYAASALLTLIHESVHQRGIRDEGLADCTALPLVPQFAASHFSVAPTVAAQRTVTTQQQQVVTVDEQRVVVTPKRVRKNGKWTTVNVTSVVTVPVERTVTVNVTSVVTEQVANPFLAQLATDAHRWHRAKPPEYQGGC